MKMMVNVNATPTQKPKAPIPQHWQHESPLPPIQPCTHLSPVEVAPQREPFVQNVIWHFGAQIHSFSVTINDRRRSLQPVYNLIKPRKYMKSNCFWKKATIRALKSVCRKTKSRFVEFPYFACLSFWTKISSLWLWPKQLKENGGRRACEKMFRSTFLSKEFRNFIVAIECELSMKEDSHPKSRNIEIQRPEWEATLPLEHPRAKMNSKEEFIF